MTSTRVSSSAAWAARPRSMWPRESDRRSRRECRRVWRSLMAVTDCRRCSRPQARHCSGVEPRRLALRSPRARCHSALSSSSGTPGAGDRRDPEERQPERARRVAPARSSTARRRPARRSCWRRRAAVSPPAPADRAPARAAPCRDPRPGPGRWRPRRPRRGPAPSVRSRWRRNWWPEPEPAVRAFDQPGHVGHDEAAIVAQADDAEVRRERRERIVGNLADARPRCAR